MGTACVVAAAFAAGPAAANSLAGFTSMVDTHYTHTTFSSDISGNWNGWSLGGAIAMPVEDIAGINWQLDGEYTHGWNGKDNTFDSDGNCIVCNASSSETWNFGFSPFWAGAQGRVGINLNYLTTTHLGHVTNGGVFGEWYFGNITAFAKAGWLSSGGTPIGGHGNYYGGGVTGYIMPNLSLTGMVNWSDLVTGASLNFDCFASNCGRRDFNQLSYAAVIEFLVSERIPISIYGGFEYTQYTVTENAKFSGADFNASTFIVGVRFYPGAGALINKHRDGNLAGWLRGADFRALGFDQ